MQEMDERLKEVKNLDKYLLIAVLHHHVVPITDARFTHWHRQLFIPENTLQLCDAPEFIAWLEKHNAQCVLHGHRHIPFVTRQGRIQIIACGSSTNQIVRRAPKRMHVSYNLIKIDGETKSATCTQYIKAPYGEESVLAEKINLR